MTWFISINHSGWVGITFWKRRLLDSLVLTIENFATSIRFVKNKATVNASWVWFMHFAARVVMTRVAQSGYIHIGVRLRVARFDKSGNAKALQSGASNK